MSKTIEQLLEEVTKNGIIREIEFVEGLEESLNLTLKHLETIEVPDGVYATLFVDNGNFEELKESLKQYTVKEDIKKFKEGLKETEETGEVPKDAKHKFRHPTDEEFENLGTDFYYMPDLYYLAEELDEVGKGPERKK